MLNFILKSLFIIGLFSVLSIPAHASTIKVAPDIEVSDYEIIEGNTYIVAGTTRMYAKNKGDVLSIHGDGVISGEVFGDVLVIGGVTEINGIIHGDVRIIGGKVTINAKIKGDVAALSGSMVFNKASEVSGDVIIISEQAILDGLFNGKIQGITNNFELKGILKNSVNSTTNRIVVRDGAMILGDINYESQSDILIEDASNVYGKISYNKIKSIRDREFVKRTIVTFLSFWRVLQFITTLLLAFILIHVFKIFTKDTTDFILNKFFRSFIIGILSIIIIPIVAFILFISIFALPIGIILLSLYIVGIMTSTAIAGIYLGVFFKKITHKGKQGVISFSSTTIALLIITLLQFIPVYGEIIRIVVSVVAFGGIARTIYQSIRFHGKKINI